MNHIQNFFPGPGAVGAGCCIRDTMLGNEFIGVILVGIQPQVGKIGVFIVGNHRHGLDILNSNSAGTVNHQIEVNDFADQIEVVRLSRDEISERVEDDSMVCATWVWVPMMTSAPQLMIFCARSLTSSRTM